MSSYNIALNFEDGVTRFVECKAGEKVLDAAFRATTWATITSKTR
jgi:benzoate/toluate 1,2-dioxygenase reductase subunit